jgi:hypothetical protein
LKKEGLAGLVVPSGIHTDLGTMQIRKMLFDDCLLTGLFGFENRKGIFEDVHRSYKFDILTFAKTGKTNTFPAVFMRHDVEELEVFPNKEGLEMSVDLIRRISPNSLSVPEFKKEIEVRIAEKMLKFPKMGDEIDGKPFLKLQQEINMTSDSNLFKTTPGPGYLPLYEGKMIWQFDAHYAQPRYWVDEKEGRKRILGRETDRGQKIGYEEYRLGIRSIARSTDKRTIISTLIPRKTFCGNSILISHGKNQLEARGKDLLLLVSNLNSHVLDFWVRNIVSANINMFYLYQLPVLHFSNENKLFIPICIKAALLVCTSTEFDCLAKEVGLKGWEDGVTGARERNQLQAELDAMVAKLYGLNAEELNYVLSTFPIVKEEQKRMIREKFKEL